MTNNNTTSDWLADDDNYTGYTDEEINRAEDEGEMALAPEPEVDLSGINPDCNESQQFRGDEFNVNNDVDLDDELASIPL
jgi:hypothetical protein